MTDADERQKADLISRARQQLAAVTDEFQRGLASVKDPAQRRRLTAGYVDTVQKYLAKAQEGLAHYRDKLQSSNTANPHGQPPDQLADRGIV